MFEETSIVATSLISSRSRASVEDSTTKLIRNVTNMVGKINDYWDQIHMDKLTREKRIEHAFQHFYGLISDIVITEEKMVKEVHAQIEANRKQLNELNLMFNQAFFDESKYLPGSISLLRALHSEISELKSKRDIVIDEQRSCFSQLVHASRRIGMPTNYIEGVETKILPSKDLDRIKELIDERKNILCERIGKILRYQSEARKILEMVDRSNCHFTSEESELLETDFAQGNTIVSEEVLKNLDAILERLENDYDQWLENVAFRYDELLVKLDEVSGKCFRKPLADKYPPNFEPGKHGERDLIKLEKEVNERQEVYFRAQPVFNKLNEWLSCWKEKLDMQRKVCRASFYNTRGGKLNQKIKNQRQINQRLPQLFTELQEIVENYITSNSLQDILIEGLRADKYAQSIMDRYNEDHDMERANKHLAGGHNTTNPTPVTSNRTRNVFATPAKFATTISTASRFKTPTQPAHFHATDANTRGAKITPNVSVRNKRKRSLSCGNETLPTSNIKPQYEPRSFASTATDETYNTTSSSGVSSTIPKFQSISKNRSRVAMAPRMGEIIGTPLPLQCNSQYYRPHPICEPPTNSTKKQKQKPWY